MIPARTRLAPSPTGFMHVGTLRNALYCYLVARQTGGQFLLRIEDTDQKRTVPGALEDIMESLRWAGLNFDEGPDIGGPVAPYIQSQKLDVYKKRAIELVQKGLAYRCFCTNEELDKMREAQTARKQPPKYDGRCLFLTKKETEEKLAHGVPYVIRLKMPKEPTILCQDLLRGCVEFGSKDLDDAVLLKSDGFPTYHLAAVVDDHEMGITHVIRGEEWLSSLPKHITLYKYFEWEAPIFIHLPLLLSADKKKLSKRKGDVSVREYRAKGYLPEALVNFVLMLGWNPGTDKEIFTMEEMIKEFSLEKLNRSGAVFNLEKLDWMNNQYIKNYDLDKLAKIAIDILVKAGMIKEAEGSYESMSGKKLNYDYLKKIVKVEKDRLNYVAEIANAEKLGFLLNDDISYPADTLKWKEMTVVDIKDKLMKAREVLAGVSDDKFNQEDLKNTFFNYLKENNIKTGEMLWPLRVSLTGLKQSPDPFEVAGIIGKEMTLKRVEKALLFFQ